MILDTCALLWLASGSKRLSHAALKEINAAPAVYVSAISGFEIAIKAAKGKLKLPHLPQDWFEKVVAHHGLTVLPLGLSICITAAELPRVHDDPYDRFIIATAKLNDLSVVTADERFEASGLTVLC
ncbi:MAG TPA: type II toxin-antitoxin system VapC family toxin [Verrucomicrobiae bacterium]|nr:type II toxin-antitoxin system VapC family toxin [Verrucomicrobiae bacterium]